MSDSCAAPSRTALRRMRLLVNPGRFARCCVVRVTLAHSCRGGDEETPPCLWGECTLASTRHEFGRNIFPDRFRELWKPPAPKPPRLGSSYESVSSYRASSTRVETVAVKQPTPVSRFFHREGTAHPPPCSPASRLDINFAWRATVFRRRDVGALACTYY